MLVVLLKQTLWLKKLPRPKGHIWPKQKKKDMSNLCLALQDRSIECPDTIHYKHAFPAPKLFYNFTLPLGD